MQTMQPDRALTASLLRIEALRDPVIEVVGHNPRSAYVRRYWLPLTGPATLLLAETLLDGLDRHPNGYEVDLMLLGASLGLPGQGRRSSTIVRTLHRLERLGLARHHPAHGLYRVRSAWPPLNRHQLAKLPAPLAALHPAA